MKATQLLKSQHREAAKIFSELEKGRAANAAERVQSLVTKLGAHMVIEQELFYPTVKSIKPALVLESFEEHAGAQAMMERLLQTEPEDESFKARLTHAERDDSASRGGGGKRPVPLGREEDETGGAFCPRRANEGPLR